MFGYACRETDALMPAPIHYAHAILHRIRELRHIQRQVGRGPAARRQEPGHAALCRRQAGGGDQRRGVHPARRGPGPGRDQAHAVADRGEHAAERLDVPGGRVPREPDRQVRHRRSGRRLRPDRDARSSSTPMAARRRMAAARSAARIRPRSIAPPPMPAAIWPRTSWPRGWRTAAPSRSATRSAFPVRCRSMSTCRAPARTSTRRGWSGRCAR